MTSGPSVQRPRVPPPLGPGSVIAVTAPSSGVREALRPRFGFCADRVRGHGFAVREGACLFSEGIVSAPAAARAAELEALLADDGVDAVMPPWGGELLIDILPLLDWDALARTPPRWFVGWSDGTTFMLPLLTRAGTMSLHGMNFMDAGFRPAPGAAAWWDVLALPPGASFRQSALGHYQGSFEDYVDHPTLAEWTPERPTRWRRLGPDADVRVRGRLVGGCADVLSRLVGTPFGEVDRFAREQAPDGTVVFLENCEMTPPDAARCWHQLVLAGWFDRAGAVLLGRSRAPEQDAYTQRAAIEDAFGSLVARGVPVLTDVDIGHQPPQLLIVNGAEATVDYRADGTAEIVQRLA